MCMKSNLTVRLICFLSPYIHSLKATLWDSVSWDLIHYIWSGIFHLWCSLHPRNISDGVVFVISSLWIKSAQVYLFSFLSFVFPQVDWFWRVFWDGYLWLYTCCIYHLGLNGFMKSVSSGGSNIFKVVSCWGRISAMWTENYLGFSNLLGWAV